jgi:flagellin-like protein
VRLAATAELSPEKRTPARAVSTRSRRRIRSWRSRRGVSDVVATILLLALTVTLFASIFAFVTSFPAPPAQNSNQFQATLIYNSGSTAIIGLNIVHLAGPQVSTSAQIYLKSAGHPCVSGCPFVGSVPVSLGITTPYWNLGQTWTALFTSFPGSSSYPGDPVPDNITVSIVTDANLIFSVILPGQAISVPATITATWIAPGSPTVGTAYEVFATVAGTLGTNPVYLTGVPGEATGPQQMTYNSASAYWYYNIPSGGPSAGTFVGFVSATSSNGASATAPVTVVIAAGSSGGSTLSVAVSVSQAPPQTGGATSLVAYVTYTGSLANAPLTVSFYANQTSPAASSSFTGAGPAGLTISGPGAQTVFSTTQWSIPVSPGPRTYNLVASATVGGVGSTQGNFVFVVPLGLTHGVFSTLPLTTCTYGTNCPTYSAKLYLNSSGYGAGPFSTVTSIYVNYTANGTSAKGGSQNWVGLTGTTISPTTSPVTITTPNEFQPHKKSVSYTVTIVVTVIGVGIVLQNTYTFSPTS